MRSVDSNPELFHGLTIWAPPGDQRASANELRLAAQIRGDGGAAVTDEWRTGTTLALSIGPAAEVSSEDGHPVILPAEDARALRDLLNIATARGYL